ncbi:MAG TPA: ATP-binding protein [Thermoanaerobaculia bacterium]|nr:ATP-binding protein [Thermoanaerobaculia bacterium]
MNDLPLPRLLESQLEFLLRTFPAVIVTGARQTGKSTLVRQIPGSPPRIYLTLDDLDVLERARQEPAALVETSTPVTLDEVQRSPDLLLAVKRSIDEQRTPGRFLLTGSANLLLLRRISETLAGRAAHLTLWPLTRREQLGLGAAGAWSRLFAAPDRDWPELLAAESAPDEDWKALARRGGYPTPAYEFGDPDARSAWFAGYTRTYLERDLQEISSVASLVDFRRLMRVACLRLGNLVNQTEIARDVGISQPSVHRYLNLLEATYQVVRLPAFTVNRTKRLLKAPRLFWSDTGLALHLAGESEPRGAHLENIVLADLLAWRESTREGAEILYWRTTAGDEVDFVIEKNGLLLPIEVKAALRPSLADTRSLQLFRREYGDHTRTGLLLHAGSELVWLADGILAAPWWKVV